MSPLGRLDSRRPKTVSEIRIEIIERAVKTANASAEQDKKAMPDATDKRKIDMTQRSASRLTSTILRTAESDAISYYGKYAQVSEDYAGSSAFSNSMKVVSLVQQAGKQAASLVVDAATGNIPALVIDTLTSLTQAYNTYRQTWQEYNQALEQLNQNAFSNYFYGARAGYADGGRGTNN